MVNRTTPRAHISLGFPQYGRPVTDKQFLVLEMLDKDWNQHLFHAIVMSALESSESFKVQFIATSKMIIKMSKHGERLCCFYIQSDRQRIVLKRGVLLNPN